nr:hypothetical protein [Tanacetum cinerariifolium]
SPFENYTKLQKGMKYSWVQVLYKGLGRSLDCMCRFWLLKVMEMGDR